MGIIVGLLVSAKASLRARRPGGCTISTCADNNDDSALDRDRRVQRDLARHAVRRLAHRAHDGLAHHQAAAGRRVLRRDGRRDRDPARHALRHSGEHDAHDHGIDRRRGRDAAAVGGALGHRGPHRLGLGRSRSPRRASWRRSPTTFWRASSRSRTVGRTIGPRSIPSGRSGRRYELVRRAVCYGRIVRSALLAPRCSIAARPSKPALRCTSTAS